MSEIKKEKPEDLNELPIELPQDFHELQQGLTPEEELALEAQRHAERETRLAPFRAIKERINMCLRANVQAGQITTEQIIQQKEAFPLFEPGMELRPGDVVRAGDEVWKTIKDNKDQATLAPGPTTAALFEKVEAVKKNPVRE